jgi:hypothetical protein
MTSEQADSLLLLIQAQQVSLDQLTQGHSDLLLAVQWCFAALVVSVFFNVLGAMRK